MGLPEVSLAEEELFLGLEVGREDVRQLRVGRWSGPALATCAEEVDNAGGGILEGGDVVGDEVVVVGHEEPRRRRRGNSRSR